MRKICPVCRFRFFGNPKTLKRNKQIVKMLKSGDFTLQMVGDHYGITRERARQIYRTTTGTPYDCYRGKKLNKEKGKLNKIHLKEVKFLCKACHSPVTHKDGRYKHHLCSKCHEIMNKEQRDPYVVNLCLNCDKPFHPSRNRKRLKGFRGFFGSRKCYFAFMRRNGVGPRTLDDFLLRSYKITS